MSYNHPLNTTRYQRVLCVFEDLLGKADKYLNLKIAEMEQKKAHMNIEQKTITLIITWEEEAIKDKFLPNVMTILIGVHPDKSLASIVSDFQSVLEKKHNATILKIKGEFTHESE
jgi:hypothetical protein